MAMTRLVRGAEEGTVTAEMAVVLPAPAVVLVFALWSVATFAFSVGGAVAARHRAASAAGDAVARSGAGGLGPSLGSVRNGSGAPGPDEADR